MAKAIEKPSLECIVRDSELVKANDNERAFNYEINEKAAKNKLIKGAKRSVFEIVKNSSSSNLLFNLGSWHIVVLPSIRYWNNMKGETCTLGETAIKIADVKTGKDIGGKHIDTQIVFYSNRDKIVMHLYNTTQLILVNGHGYEKFIDIFLKPYFESKVDLNLESIEKFNTTALDARGGWKMVKRSSVKFTEAPTHLWCTRCDYAAKSRAALAKHKKSVHALKIGSEIFPSTSLTTPKHHSTSNNTISEAIMDENIILKDIINTVDDVESIQSEETKLLRFVCGICQCEFDKQENYNNHMKIHDKEVKTLELLDVTAKDESGDPITLEEESVSNSNICHMWLKSFENNEDLN